MTSQKRQKLTSLEAESHGLINDPANNDEEWSDAKGNLDGGANGDVHGKIHLVADGNNNGGDVLGGVSNNRDEDQTDECLANMHLLDNVVNAANEVVCANGDKNGDGDENETSSKGAHVSNLWLFIVLDDLALRVKEVAVGAELEEEVHDVEEEQDDGSAAGEREDALSLALGAALVEDTVKLLEYLVSMLLL